MSRPGRKSASQTPAPKSDKIYGSKKNAPGSASSKKSAKSITLSKSIIKSLEEKLTEFRKNHDKNITINDLKAVYRRGLGAYSSTHRPTITGGAPNTRNAWAMARVNKFLKKAGGEKVKAAYVQDDDLMKDGGEIFKRGGKTKEEKGDCYVAAGDIVMNYLMKDRGFGKYVFGESEFNFHGTPYLVHAEVSGQGQLEGVRYGHAWVEDDILVYDYSNGRKIVFPKELYYAIGGVNTENPKKYQKYTFEEAKNKMIDTGHYGCWDLDVEFGIGGDITKQKYSNGGITTKNSVIDAILKEAEPVQDEITQQWYDEVTKKGIKVTDSNIELYKYNLVVDLVKAVGNYIEQGDSIKNIHIDRSRQGYIVISCIIEREGNEYGFSTEVIYAGGHSIQKLHLRYIVKTRLPHKRSNTYYDKLNEELKRRTKIEKLNEELGWAENRLRISKENLEKAIKNSKLSDEEVERISREEKPEEWKYYRETTWEEIVERGADKNYDYSEEKFNKSMKEAKKSLIDFWRYRNANVKQSELSIKTEEKEIEKWKKRISELQPKEFFDGGQFENVDLENLAPNGKPSNLTPEQYKLVRTPEFKAWFGDWENDPENASKVVDENGEPRVVWHGSKTKWWNKNFVFNPAYEGSSTGVKRRHQGGIYFSSNFKVAESYTFSKKSDDVPTGFVLPFFLNFRNPIKIDGNGEEMQEVLGQYGENMRGEKVRYEYRKDDDSDIIIYNVYDDFFYGNGEIPPSDIFITSNTFDRIKIADGSNIKFDANNPDVRYEDGGLLPQGTLYTRDKKNKLEYYKKGNDYAFKVYDVESNIVQNENEALMTYNQFINYLYSEEFIDGNNQDGGLIAPNGKKSNLTAEQYKLVRTPEFKAWFGDWENDPENASKVVDENGEPLVVYHASTSKEIYYQFDKNYINIKDPDFWCNGFWFSSEISNTSDWTNLGGERYIRSFFLNVRNILKNEKIDDYENEYYDEIDENNGTQNRYKLIKRGYDGVEFVKIRNIYKDVLIDIKNKKELIHIDKNSELVLDKINQDNVYVLKENGQSIDTIYIDTYNGKKLDDSYFQFSKQVIKDLSKGGVIIVFEPNQIKLADGSNTTFEGNNPDIRYEDGGNLKSDESFQEYNDFKNNKLKSMDIVCVNCMWEWNLADTEPQDKYVCHRCGFDNTPFYTVFKETMSLEDIAQKHNVDMDYLQKQFEIGSKHEEDEHTKKGTKLAKEVGETIALHHLEEMPDYYERIKDLENQTDNFKNQTDFKLKNGLVEFENYQEPEVEYVKYAVWYPGKNKVAEAYDFAELSEAVNHIKRNGGNGVIRDFDGRKVINNDDLQKVLKGERRYYEFEDGGDIKEPKSEYEIADFLEEQKEEADAILFSRRTMIGKIMICNAYIEMAEQKIEQGETAIIKNVWQQVKYIWETTKEEVDDVIYMYEEGGEAGGCGCTKRMAKGGLAYGNSHDKGGMPMKVKSTGQNIEIEGGEGVINKRSMQMTKRVEFEGQKLTPCEVISKINEMGGGVKFNCDDVKQIIEKDGDF